MKLRLYISISIHVTISLPFSVSGWIRVDSGLYRSESNLLQSVLI